MPRDIPTGKKMPSLVVAIGDKGGPKGAPPAPGADATPDASPDETFHCPACGATLSVESKDEADSEHSAMGGDEAA